MKVSVQIKDGEQFFIQLPVLPRVGDELFMHHTEGGNHCYKVTDVVFYIKEIETASDEKVVVYDELIALFVEKSKF